ncbi:MAG: hypothetical protein FJ296_02045 [Planctomycetes bacterium]|nr:hypothetical protein [Planctomycetota bacterium]
MNRCLAVLVLSLLAACGGKSPADCCAAADEALRKGNHAEAQSRAEEGLALGGMDAGTNSKLERIRLEALAGKGELAQVLAGLTAAAARYPGMVDDQLYAKLGTALADGGKLVDAIELVEVGKKAFPEKVKSFDGLVASITKAATEGGDNAAVERLKQLGYL